MKVSIIITSYNYGAFIERCLRSCNEQSLPKSEYEIIVVDDFSSDNTETIVGNLNWINNLTYIKNKKNLGVAATSNVGMRRAKGRYVIRVDADDYVSSDFIYLLSKYLESNPEALGVSCDYFLVDNNEQKIKRVYASEYPVSCGIMYRKDILIKHGMYNPDWRHREEEELRKRMGNLYQIHSLRIPLYRYRQHDNNKTKQKDYKTTKKDLLNVVPITKNQVNTDSIYDFNNLKNNIVAVIPARGGSKRLKKKNIYKILDKPMIEWVIDAAKKSKYINDIFVSTEDDDIKNILKNLSVKIIDRPNYLSEDNVIKQDVIKHAVKQIEKNEYKPTLIVSLQPNSPDIISNDIDNAIEKLLKYKKQEVMSVDDDLNGNAALRVLTYDAVMQNFLSTNFGVIKIDVSDIHNKNDVEKTEKKLLKS